MRQIKLEGSSSCLISSLGQPKRHANEGAAAPLDILPSNLFSVHRRLNSTVSRKWSSLVSVRQEERITFPKASEIFHVHSHLPSYSHQATLSMTPFLYIQEVARKYSIAHPTSRKRPQWNSITVLMWHLKVPPNEFGPSQEIFEAVCDARRLLLERQRGSPNDEHQVSGSDGGRYAYQSLVGGLKTYWKKCRGEGYEPIRGHFNHVRF